ncbi:MAG: mercuric transporter MerT family protein [Gammaproteobacteria bacterium]
MTSSSPRLFLTGSILSTGGALLCCVASGLCCVVPFVFVLLGISGTWLSRLTALEPYRPIFVVLTLGFLGMAFWRLYRPASLCPPGEVCAVPSVRRRQRIVFWLMAIPILALLAFPWIAPLFLL